MAVSLAIKVFTYLSCLQICSAEQKDSIKIFGNRRILGLGINGSYQVKDIDTLLTRRRGYPSILLRMEGRGSSEKVKGLRALFFYS